MHTDWFIGYAVGVGVVAIVVLLLVVLIALAKRIAAEAEDIVTALEAARDNTAPVWSVAETNRSLQRITGGAVAAREVLEARGGAG